VAPKEENDMSDQKQTLARRTLLGGLATAGAAVGAVALVRGKAEPAPAPQTTAQVTDASQGEGYRLTDHIKQYYATARI
jgi:hypothetical protein